MWTVENRKPYERSHLSYPSDLTDEEWRVKVRTRGRRSFGSMPPIFLRVQIRNVDVYALLSSCSRSLVHDG
jgi:hypothetical protein